MIVDRIDPCPSCGRVHGRISYSGPERRHAPDEPVSVGRFLLLLVVAVLGLAAVVAPWIWVLTRV